MIAGREWVQDAVCRGTPHSNEMMFSFSRQGIELAQMLCSTCPVRVQCLRYAIRQGEDHGVWGGVEAKDRYQLRRGKLRKVRMYVGGKWRIVDPFSENL